MRKCMPGVLTVLLALSLGCPGDPDTDYRAAIKKDLDEELKFNCPPGRHWALKCTPGTICSRKCEFDEVR